MLCRLALRAACVWLVLTLLVSLWGPQTIVAARPLVQAMVEWMLPGFITRVMLKPPPDDGTNRAAAGGDVATWRWNCRRWRRCRSPGRWA
jgi:hypothetical protein